MLKDNLKILRFAGDIHHSFTFKNLAKFRQHYTRVGMWFCRGDMAKAK
jgi:hypothetical protein